MTSRSVLHQRDPVVPSCAIATFLVVADTRATANALDALLGHPGGVRYVESGAHDMVFAAARGASLLILDLDSMTTCGLETLDSLRCAGIEQPIVAVSATEDQTVATRAYDLGADAVLAASIAPSELLARCKALLRRAASPTDTAQTVASDRPAGAIAGAGDLRLSAMQSAVLEQLARRPGQVVTRQMLLDQLYSGVDTPAAGVIDFFIHGIRRELAASGSELVIETLRGVGFRLRAKPAAG